QEAFVEFQKNPSFAIQNAWDLTPKEDLEVEYGYVSKDLAKELNDFTDALLK
ncbi:hypothetical protein LCGC14_2426150, partial [marine sediment metagenome]